jgi:hypothetical protein
MNWVKWYAVALIVSTNLGAMRRAIKLNYPLKDLYAAILLDFVIHIPILLALFGVVK